MAISVADAILAGRIARRIVAERGRLNLSQTELARRLDVSQRIVSHWEHAERLPSATSIISLCQIFNVSADELLGLELQPCSTAK